MKYKILQIPFYSRLYNHKNLSDCDNLNLSEYKLVYDGETEFKTKNVLDVLQDAVETSNTIPISYKGSPISVSDIVIIEDRIYYFRLYGCWKDVTDKVVHINK